LKHKEIEMKRKLVLALLMTGTVMFSNAVLQAAVHSQKNDAERFADDVGKKTKSTTKGVAKGSKKTGKAVSKGSEKTAKGTATVVEDTSKVGADGVKKTGKATAKGIRKVGKRL
jgi:hypothetical protein